MKKNTVLKEYAKYSSLNVLGMLALSCYILADTFFVSKGLGANGLTALNLAIPIYSFIHGTGLMIGIGAATQYSISKSQKDDNSANSIFTNAVLLTAGFSVIFFTIGLFLSGQITRLLGADENVYEMSKIYLQVILLFSPMFLTNNLLLCFVRNDGAPQLSMAAMILGSLSNVVLDYIFIFPLVMGIFGAVLATGIAPIVSVCVLLPHFIKKKHGFHFRWQKPQLRTAVTIFSGGLPSLVTEVSSGIVIIVFNIIILGLEGNIGVAAYGVIANLSLVVISVYTGVAQGIQPILSRNYGKNETQNVKRILRYALITVFVISAIIYSCTFLFASQIATIFNSENNAVLQDIAVNGMRLYFTAILFAGINIITSIYHTSTENPRPANIISILRGFVVIIPMAFIMAEIFGMNGVWLAFALTELCVCVVSVFSILGLGKRKAG